VSKRAGDLEVCYINEIAFDDDRIREESDEDEENNFPNSSIAEAGPPEPDSAEPGRFPRSKSDWEAFRNPGLLSVAAAAPTREQKGKR
jgi:hypothetical protein